MTAQVLRSRILRRGCSLPLALALLLAACALDGCGPAAEPAPTFQPSTPAEAAALTYFTGSVKPVLKGECYRCHGTLNHKGGFNLSTRAQLLAGGHHGAAVVPGHPEQSLLSGDEIAAISKWIADGAIMDR